MLGNMEGRKEGRKEGREMVGLKGKGGREDRKENAIEIKER